MTAVLHRTDSQPAQTLHVTRLEPTIGAEISGIDLSQPLTPALRDELRRLLLEHKVIFFRDQPISTEQQIAFAREFGELYVHPTTQQKDPTKPQAHLIQAQDERKLYGPRTSGRWHTDTSWLLRPTLGAVLRAVDLPPVGGDTLWADTGAVYRALPEDLRQEIDDLHVVHDFKSSLDNKVLEALWKTYWVNTLSANPLVTNANYITSQLADLGAKLEQVSLFVRLI